MVVSGVVALLGGLALFLFGVEESTRASRSALGGDERAFLGRLASRTSGAFCFGALLSVLSQSSSVATSFAVGLVDLGVLPFAGSLLVMMGASVGAAAVTFLLSLDVGVLAPAVLAAGSGAALLGRGRWRTAGQVVRGLGLVLLGMFLIKLGVDPLMRTPQARELILGASRWPLVLGGAALAVTALLQSSSAVLALGIALASSGVLSLGALVPLVLGAHVGSAAPVLLSSLGAKRNARRLGAATCLYKLCGALAVLPLVPWLVRFLEGSGISPAQAVPWIGAGVTGLNALLGIPLAGALASLAGRWFVGAEAVGEPQFLDDTLARVPGLALKLLDREMSRLANLLETFLYLLAESPQEEERIERFRRGLPDLAESCVGYLDSLEFPDPETRRRAYGEYEFPLLSMGGLARTLAQDLSGPAMRFHHREGVSLSRAPGWSGLYETLKELLRDALGAFALGDESLAERARRAFRRYEVQEGAWNGGWAGGDSGAGSRTPRQEAWSLLEAFGSLARYAQEMVRERGIAPSAPSPEPTSSPGPLPPSPPLSGAP